MGSHRPTEDEMAQVLFEVEERAAIKEYEGGMSRAQAEHEALREVVAAWTAFPPVPESERLKAEVDMAAWVRRVRDRQKAKSAVR